MGHGKSTKEVEQFLKWGSAPNPVPASLRLRRQYGQWLVLVWLVLVWLVLVWLVLVGWFWLVGLDGCFGCRFCWMVLVN